MHLLLVEDDPMLADAVCAGARQNGWSIDHAGDAGAARLALLGQPYSVLLLDIGLPGDSGLSVLKDMRARYDITPVLILTARGQLSERILGLDAGADDYLVKPFQFDELWARVRAMVRRSQGRVVPLLRCGEIELELGKRVVTRAGARVVLSAHAAPGRGRVERTDRARHARIRYPGPAPWPRHCARSRAGPHRLRHRRDRHPAAQPDRQRAALHGAGRTGAHQLRPHRGGRDDRPHVFLEVADDGPGVPEAEREAIFGRFHRVAGNRARGSGIGLSLVAGIAALHRAGIVTGAGLDGRGFSIRLLFPAAP